MTARIAGVLGLLLIVGNNMVANYINEQVTEPYMDEPFHVPQAQAYCRGNLSHWDPKITTPPGLYLASLLLLWPVSILFGESTVDQWCSIIRLRATNLLWSIGLFYVLYCLSRQLHPRARLSQHAWNAFTLAIFPVGYFYNFLYYTDTGSMTLVLLAYLLALKQKHALAGVMAAGSLLFRQTNVIWTAWIMALVIVSKAASFDKQQHLQRWLSSPANAYSPAETMTQLQRLIRQTIGNILSITYTSLPYLCVLLDLVHLLCDKSNHEATLHFPQLFYFSCFTFGFSIIQLMWPISRIRRTLVRTLRHPVLFLISIGLILYLIHHFTYEHPFILSDNRHFTFYLWKRIYSVHPSVKYVLAPAYALVIQHLWIQLAQRQNITWCIGYTAAVALTLVPSPLLEFRYFILPFIIYRLHLSPVSNRYILSSRPFQWPQEPGVWQRFMW
ncbi:alpha-2-glucosyltransferase Alg10 [Syncephalis fuscata]|nr:alpha-2-glucosyltransferase Alg10 [Syncephalis fuscata]